MMAPESVEDFATLLKGDGKFVCYFTAAWCGDCRFIQQILSSRICLVSKLPTLI